MAFKKKYFFLRKIKITLYLFSIISILFFILIFGNKIFAQQTLQAQPKVYVFNGNGNWSNSSNWLGSIKPPGLLPKGDSILLQTDPSDSCVLDVAQYLAEGSVLKVVDGSSFFIRNGIFQLIPGDSLFTDSRDGQVYTFKKYGNDIWMTMNLNFYTPVSKLYNNDTINSPLYGRLYNWYDAKNAVPEGWHLPTWGEWQALKIGQTGRTSFMDTLLWDCMEVGPSNSTRFNGRPGGIFVYDRFHFEGSQTRWWSDSSSGGGSIYSFGIMCSVQDWWLIAGSPKSSASYSVRCVKNKFPPPPPPPPPDYDTTFTDPRDGQVYPVKMYEGKIWMTKNLNYKSALSKVYNNDTLQASVYGRLYDWNGAKAAVPAGWHLPSMDEWNALIELNGGTKVGAGPMKDTLYWQLPNTSGSNSSGFSARPGGIYAQPNFEDIGNYGLWWTSTEHSEVGSFNWAYYFQAGYNSGSFFYYYLEKYYGLSVRCVKN